MFPFSSISFCIAYVASLFFGTHTLRISISSWYLNPFIITHYRTIFGNFLCCEVYSSAINIASLSFFDWCSNKHMFFLFFETHIYHSVWSGFLTHSICVILIYAPNQVLSFSWGLDSISYNNKKEESQEKRKVWINKIGFLLRFLNYVWQ